MPFRSKAQMRLCFSGRMGLSKEECRQLARSSPKNLPEYVSGKRKTSKKKTPKRKSTPKRKTSRKRSPKKGKRSRGSRGSQFVFKGSRGGRYIKRKGRRVYL